MHYARFSQEEREQSNNPDVSPAKSTRGGWKKILAFAIVAIMVAAGFVALAPVLKADHGKAVLAPNEAGASAMGQREVSYTLNHMFESYQKVSGPQSSHGGPPAINTWWYNRCATYGDVVVRDRFPFVVGYGPYSAEVPGAGVAIATMKYGLYGFYRTTIDARNLTTIGTGAGKEAAFFPILYPSWTTGLNMNGGYMNLSYYLTYATIEDEVAANSGTSYQKTYYGVPAGAFNFGGANADDGWYIEFEGKADFNRAAAKKFLGLTGSADLRTQFTANNTGANAGKLNTTLANWWTNDGSNPGNNDTYCSYDYSLDYSPLSNGGIFMSVDPLLSTSDHLYLRMYAIVWGIENLMNRYLDRIGVMSNLVTSPEDWYLNVSLTPEGGNVFSRYVSCYNILAWKDPGYFSPSWMIDTVHMDYTPNNAAHSGAPPKWTSRYNQYYATKVYKPTYMEWTPGTLAYGTGVAYWYPPMAWNLTNNEKLQIKLPSASTSMLGYMPYKGTGTSDKIVQSKLDELGANTVWGEVGLGTISPASLRNNYDPATKTLTIVGPTAFNRNPNTLFHNINATGTPNFQFDVMRVSNYEMAMQEAPPYSPGQTYHLQVTAKNITGAVVTNWNGTAVMTAPAEVTLGASQVTFVNGVASITISSSSAGTKVITAKDSHNDLDVVNTISVTFGPGNVPPSVTPLSNIQAWAGASTTFTATATDADLDPLRYTWNFGDGSALQVGNPTTHTYAVGKTYTFTVYVDDLTGLGGHNVSSSATAQIAFNKVLAAGWNLVSLPLTGYGYKASNIGLATGDMCVLWNSSTQTYQKTYIKGISGAAMDFNIEPNTGYWIWVAVGKTLHWYGTLPTTPMARTVLLPASGTGWFTLGFVGYPSTMKAANVPGQFTPTGKITMVAYYDTATKSYKTWISAVPTLNNFNIVGGQGYWCYASGATSLALSYTPVG